jgi:hypothetical protein
VAISFINSASNGAINAGAVTVTLPGSMVANDLIILAYCAGDNDNIDADLTLTTGGYTEVADLFGNGTEEANLAVFYTYWNGTDTNVVAAASGLGTDSASSCALMVFRDVALAGDGGPFDVTSTTATGTTGGSPDPASIDWSTAGTWVVIAGGSGGGALNATTYTFPTGYTTNALTRADNDTIDSQVGLGYNTAPSDPENPGVMTTGGTGTGWAAVTMALKPATVAADVQFGTHYADRSIYPGPTS